MSQKLLRKVVAAYDNSDMRSLAMVMEEVRLALEKPEQRPMSTDELDQIIHDISPFTLHEYARAIEKAHGIEGKA